MSQKNRIVLCKSFSMFRTSISIFLNKTPKIKYICGECGLYNEGRINVSNVKEGYPYIKCEFCGIINEIPIVFGHQDEDYDDEEDDDWF